MSMQRKADEIQLLADLAMYAFHKDRIAKLGAKDITEAALRARLKALGFNDDGSRITPPSTDDAGAEPKA